MVAEYLAKTVRNRKAMCFLCVGTATQKRKVGVQRERSGNSKGGRNIVSEGDIEIKGHREMQGGVGIEIKPRKRKDRATRSDAERQSCKET